MLIIFSMRPVRFLFYENRGKKDTFLRSTYDGIELQITLGYVGALYKMHTRHAHLFSTLCHMSGAFLKTFDETRLHGPRKNRFSVFVRCHDDPNRLKSGRKADQCYSLLSSLLNDLSLKH